MALLIPTVPLVGKSRHSAALFAAPAKGTKRFGGFRVRAFVNPFEQPVVKEALKEPIAFVSGMFAGFLRLDLSEDPLKEWLARTVEAAGVTTEEVDGGEVNHEQDTPQQIEIE